MRVIVDSNVVVSGALYGGVPERVIQLVEDGFVEASVSSELLDELSGILLRRKFSKQLAILNLPPQVVVDTWKSKCDTITASPLPNPVCRDPDDDNVLACAVAANADAIITGDRDLLILGTFQGIEILTPAAFLARFPTP